MRNTVKSLVLLTIMLSTTQQMEIANLPLSLFQIMVIVTFAVTLIDIINTKHILKGWYLGYVVVSLISGVIAFFLSTYPSWAKSYLLLAIMSAVLIVIIVNYFDYEDVDKLSLALIRSQYITIPLSLYSVVQFYRNSRRVSDINIGFISWNLSEGFETFGQASGQIRLFAPYNTGPILSVVMAMCILILLFNTRIYSLKIRGILVVIFSIILLLTGSRTGIVGLAVTLFLYALFHIRITKKQCFLIIFFMIFAIVFLIRVGNIEFFEKTLLRFSITNIMQDRHFLVPLDGLIIWLSSFKNFVFGIGFGSSINLIGEHTFLPPYFLNIYITLIVERGLMGVFMTSVLVRCLIIGLKVLLYTKNVSARAIWSAMVCGLVCGLFYEDMNCYFLIIVLGIGLMLENKKHTLMMGRKERL